MKMTRIRVDGLFGIFNHDIPVGDHGPVTVIHGPNGFGKTLILRMVRALATGSTDVFRETPFREFHVQFDNGQRALLRKTAQAGDGPGDRSNKATRNRKRRPAPEILCELFGPNGKSDTGPMPLADRPERAKLLDEIDRVVPPPYRRLEDGWIDSKTQERLSLEELLEVVPFLRDHPALRNSENLSTVDPLAAIRRGLNAYFIHTKRLVGPPKRRYSGAMYFGAVDEDNTETLAVEVYSQALAKETQRVLANYGNRSQQLDRTFPARLLQLLGAQPGKDLPSVEVTLAALRDLDHRRANLMQIGILDKEEGLADLREQDVQRAREVLSIYVKDVQEKLDVFDVDAFAKRITLLLEKVNGRFVYKSLRISRDDGFVIAPNSPPHSGDAPLIPLADLSSGEQHALVLFYELLFKIRTGALVLVDEPEISLHAAWQLRFLDDLEDVLNVSNATAIVATHSAAIINERWDQTVQLQGAVEKGTHE